MHTGLGRVDTPSTPVAALVQFTLHGPHAPDDTQYLHMRAHTHRRTPGQKLQHALQQHQLPLHRVCVLQAPPIPRTHARRRDNSA